MTPHKTPLERNDSCRSSLGVVDKFELMDGEMLVGWKWAG